MNAVHFAELGGLKTWRISLCELECISAFTLSAMQKCSVLFAHPKRPKKLSVHRWRRERHIVVGGKNNDLLACFCIHYHYCVYLYTVVKKLLVFVIIVIFVGSGIR